MGMKIGGGYAYLSIGEIAKGPLVRPFELSLRSPLTGDWSLSELGRPDLLNGKPVPEHWPKEFPFTSLVYRVEHKTENLMWLNMVESGVENG